MEGKKFENLNDKFIRVFGARIKKDKINYYEIVEYNDNIPLEKEVNAPKERVLNLQIVIGGHEKTFGSFNKDESIELLDFLDKL